MRILSKVLLFSLIALIALDASAQRRRRGNTTPASTPAIPAETFKDIKLRNIGPAFMSGRIADLAIHPKNESIWYVAVASGGVWKTVNAGTTWKPIFDDQGSFATGCIALDPKNPHVVWVGTGENVGGRHIAYGDGIYKSEDGGNTWTNMGLKKSEHLSKIIVHAENSDVIYVASQGPLWSAGGERGFFKSSDGGKTWKKTLGDEEWTGVADMVVDPRNANRIYAATWQHHRNVAAYMGGGPKTALYRSEDGGETWKKLSNGLPKGTMGKIGLAISFQQPDVVYAAIELNRRKGVVYRSADRGETWIKGADAVGGGTGPHYYQELFASPHHFDRLYMMSNTSEISLDGGKTFKPFNREHRHGDDHALAFKMSDPDYIMIGSDGGVYESFDDAKNWRYMENLPITQFYKVAVDDAAPFYNVYGGTQDNSTEGGPSRTDNVHGIQNSDWKVVLNWDGHQPATEPGNPDILYAERQEGNLSRIDMTTGEVVDIQPQPGPDEPYERFNWDAPILVSPHKATRIYFASQRVWRSENRGDEWTAISGDLTKNQNRLELPIMGSTQSWDSPWDVLAMSNYNTITSVSESPQQEGLIYIGTDDGLIQVTENGGDSWRKINVSTLPGVPATAFVNDVKADLYDANTVYVLLDNHKYGDFQPYLAKSTNRGVTWTSIRGNIPDRTLVWRIVQDHEKPELLFLGTEFGIYFTVDAAKTWTKLEGGVPVISFRDLAIQKREDDLVGASFGRGFFIFDDYSFLREVSKAKLDEEAALFNTRKAWWYIPRSHLSFDNEKGSQGAQHFVAPNPEFGATFTYYLKDGYSTLEEQRQAAEKGKTASFPGWQAVEDEKREAKPKVWIAISDQAGNVIRRVAGTAKKGMHRLTWDLRYPTPSALRLSGGDSFQPQGMMAAPGTYSAQLYKQIAGEVTALSDPIRFEVERLRDGALAGSSPEATAAFWRAYDETVRNVSTTDLKLSNMMKRVEAMQKALNNATATPGPLDEELHALKQQVLEIDADMYGLATKREIGEKTKPTIGDRLFAVDRGISRSTYGPTPTHKRSLDLVNEALNAISGKMQQAQQKMNDLDGKLKAAGAPYVEGGE